ncbi:MAG: alpha/beta hydrolase [Crocosphaera sp.]|uniref:Probable lipoprotein signal peptide n=1 Tax=Crocosphaera watsonii WH 0005 TaxID=423472 RepID=T2IWS0_CROWT|nr:MULTISPECIES: alpha/beta hydrolase [Crocosphaera]MCH2245791.1 alpha/beta hydrolase [Crocosphaera sp.]CCQ56570.1 Probable lipoprotein signal peptide [Crocosphaera watsonii WH 0005]
MRLKNSSFFLSLIGSILVTVGSHLPTIAAEKINFIVGPLRLSLNISSLETFADEGTIDRRLADYFRMAGVGEAEQIRFREILRKTVDIDPVLFSRLLRTEMGEDLLTRWGEHINIQGGRNGKYALRGAIVKSAFDEEGLTLINVLRNLPTNIQINLNQARSLATRFDSIILATNFFREEIKQLAQQEIANALPTDFATLPDLRQPGKLPVQKNQWTLTDTKRNRTFQVYIYQPQEQQNGTYPIVIASHGLASSPEHFSDYAEHLASYGYVVAIPQHPGSDRQQLQNLKRGLSRQVFLTSEFIDRPKDISYVIDELERRNQIAMRGKLDLNKIAVIGHSFGGYTALAVAGATLEFEHLAQECPGSLNLSLLLQCNALNLDPEVYSLKDERVKAIALTNPLKSAIFGPKGLSRVSIPVYVQAGKYDPATPFVLEQVRPFPWFKSSNRYLSLQEGDTHADISELDGGLAELIDNFVYLSLPEPGLLTSYNQALILAFLQVHLQENESFRPYLQSAYAEHLSQGEEFKTFLITHDSLEGLEKAIAKFQTNNPSIEF